MGKAGRATVNGQVRRAGRRRTSADRVVVRGCHRRGGPSRTGIRCDPEDFLRQVAAREGAGADEKALLSQVFEHARAVFATLSEEVSRKEWFDIVVELPEDYRPLMPASPALRAELPVNDLLVAMHRAVTAGESAGL